MKFEHSPETNRFGLVLPPSAEDLAYLRLFQRPKRKPDTVDRHHLYWPRNTWNQEELSERFRAHPFNSIWIRRSDHELIHREYDGVNIPKREVMMAFLGEADLLDLLGVTVKSVEMIDLALYEGRVKHFNKVEESRIQKIETQSTLMERVEHFEVMPIELARLAVQHFTELPMAA
jgi:hypothetical protein